jgi:aryl sulfotransferase
MATLFRLCSIALIACAFAEEAPPTPADMHLSQVRADELMAAKEGDVTSSGRELSYGHPTADREAVERWAAAPLPQRVRDYHAHHFNSDKWDLVEPRESDIVIATAFKAGTTWCQEIVKQLLFKDAGVPDLPEDMGLTELSPWVDLRVPPPAVLAQALDSMRSRRFLKSHLPLDGLRFDPNARYVMLTRDVRDVAYSWHNHWEKAVNFWPMLNALPGRIGPPVPMPGGMTPRETFRSMAAIDDERRLGLWSYYHHLATWWQYRHLPNVLLLHYANLKRDPAREISKLASFLGVALTEAELARIVAATDFKKMKEDSTKILGKQMDALFDAGDGVPGSKHFINKGINGRWVGELSDQEIEQYLAIARERLGDAAAKWLTDGEMDARGANEGGGEALKSEL